jgi:ABC-type multidrug transport system ATPase subunit
MPKDLKNQGITILVSTPYMDEARLCDTVALMQNGKLLSVNTPQGIINDFSLPVYAVKSHSMLSLLHDLKEKDFVKDAYPFGEFHHVVLKNETGIGSLSVFMEERNDTGKKWKKAEPDIEDCFIALMKTPAAAPVTMV